MQKATVLPLPMTTPPPKLRPRRRSAPATLKIPEYRPFRSATTVNYSPSLMASLVARTRAPFNDGGESASLACKDDLSSSERTAGPREPTRLGKASSRIADGSESHPILLYKRKASSPVERFVAPSADAGVPRPAPAAKLIHWWSALTWCGAGAAGVVTGYCMHRVFMDPYMRSFSSAALVPLFALMAMAALTALLSARKARGRLALALVMLGALVCFSGGAAGWFSLLMGPANRRQLFAEFAPRLGAMSGLPEQYVWIWWGGQAALIVLITLAWTRERLSNPVATRRD